MFIAIPFVGALPVRTQITLSLAQAIYHLWGSQSARNDEGILYPNSAVQLSWQGAQLTTPQWLYSGLRRYSLYT